MSVDKSSTAIGRRPAGSAMAIMSDDEMRRAWRTAEALAQSGSFPDAKTAAQAFAKMLVGMDLGMSPTKALMSVHLVEGKPQIAATALAAFVRQHDRYDYTVMEHDEEHCQIMFWMDGEEAGVSTFTIEQAKKANLVKDKSAWVKHPRNMLFARAMSNGCKWYAPDAAGGFPIYTEGDVFEAHATLTSGEGDGRPQGLDLGPKVEKVLSRATMLGHAGLADRAAAEMAVGGRSPGAIAGWVASAEMELDETRREDTQKPQEEADAEVLEAKGKVAPPAPPEQPRSEEWPEDSPKAQAKELQRIAGQLLRDANTAENEGKSYEAEALGADANELFQQAKSLEGGEE